MKIEGERFKQSYHHLSHAVFSADVHLSHDNNCPSSYSFNRQLEISISFSI